MTLGFACQAAFASKTVVDQIGSSTSTGDLGGQFRGPRGPAVNQAGSGGVPVGSVYVLDSNNARIQQLGPSGEFARAWGWGVRDGESEFEICKVAASCRKGLAGPGAGQLGSGAQGIAVDQGSGNVFVSDQANRRIDIFTATGAFVGSFGWGARTGAGEFQFCTMPTGCHAPAAAGAQGGQFGTAIGGLALDASGNVYVADKSNRRVDVFKPVSSGGTVTGIEFLRAFGWGVATGANAFETCVVASSCKAGSTAAPANQAGQFGTNSPSDVAVDSEGKVFALDAQWKRVQEFSQTPAVLNAAFGAGALSVDFGTGELLNVSIADDHVYVSGKRAGSANKIAVAELNRNGGPVDLHGVDLTTTAGNGLAVLPASLGGNIYLSTGVAITGVYILNEAPAINPVTIHTGTTAIFSGTVVSSGIPTAYHFEYSTDGQHWSSTPVPDADAGSADAKAEIAATGPSTGTLTVTASGGTFALSFNGEITSQLPYDASAAAVQSALEGLSSVGAGNVTVGGGPGDPTGSSPYTISFTGSLGGTEVSQIVADGTALLATIPVSLEASGLTGSQPYRLRLVQSRPAAGRAISAETTFETDPAAPAISDTNASQVTDTGVTLNATLNPQNQETNYHFEYVDDAEFAETGFSGANSFPAPDAAVAPSGPVSLGTDLGGLEPATTYHFRLLAANAIGSTVGDEAVFTTFPSQEVAQNCPNTQFRTGPSSRLPDCRAYELVSPPDANGLFTASLIGAAAEQSTFDTTLAATDGNSVLSYSQGTLPGAEAGGQRAAHQATRTVDGWTTREVGPNGAQAASPGPGGVSPDHQYAFWQSGEAGGSLMVGGEGARYLRTPDGGYELIGRGLLGEDPKAWGRWITAGASHVIFSTEPGSAVQLESGAPAAGIAAVYDRTPGGITHVVSLLPGDETPAADAAYNGASGDGSAVVFTIEGTMYERRDNTVTVPIAEGGVIFAGISGDGDRVFYQEGDELGPLFACDSGPGGCGPAGNDPIEITSGETAVVNISADGSHVYFASPDQLDGSEGELGARNLYVWDGATIRFIAVLAPEDFESFGGSAEIRLNRWTELQNRPPAETVGPANDPSRTTPDGDVLVFQSHANLTAYDSGGHSEIFLYDAASKSIGCVSCHPLGAAATSDAELEVISQVNAPVNSVSHIASVTDDGQAVFFQTGDALLPGDVNGREDVYEWRAGRVFLISSGRGAANSTLYAMTPDGHDVFFTTNESLVPGDQNGGSRRIYDARAGGGFAPAASAALPCQDDACQGTPSNPPFFPGSASSAFQGPGNVKAHRRHRTHRHKHKRKRHHKHRHRRADSNRGGGK